MPNVIHLHTRLSPETHATAVTVSMLASIQAALAKSGRDAIRMELLSLERTVLQFLELANAQPASRDRDIAVAKLRRVQDDIRSGFDVLNRNEPDQMAS